MTKNKDRTIQFFMILVDIFKSINIDKWIKISIVTFVLENTIDYCITFTIIGHLNLLYSTGMLSILSQRVRDQMDSLKGYSLQSSILIITFNKVYKALTIKSNRTIFLQ